MAAGVLSQAGYYMGDNLYRANARNPKGFFECAEVNGINEDILERVVPGRPRIIGNWLFGHRPERNQRWLASLAVGTHLVAPEKVAERIQGLVRREPYCFKDPRFSYTLPIWRPWLKNTSFVCMFRDPASTARSMLRSCELQPSLRGLDLSFRHAIRCWVAIYSHILQVHRYEGDWLFLHYDQLVEHSGRERLAAFSGAPVDHHFPEKSLRTSFDSSEVGTKAKAVYAELCELAGSERCMLRTNCKCT